MLAAYYSINPPTCYIHRATKVHVCNSMNRPGDADNPSHLAANLAYLSEAVRGTEQSSPYADAEKRTRSWPVRVYPCSAELVSLSRIYYCTTCGATCNPRLQPQLLLGGRRASAAPLVRSSLVSSALLKNPSPLPSPASGRALEVRLILMRNNWNAAR